MARVKIETQQRADLLRAAENHVVRANATRLRNEIGWQPQFSLEQTLQDTLNYWREQR
jgi:nucleoside-diphosphate-sugar epimerase